jgi:hypothetical protein
MQIFIHKGRITLGIMLGATEDLKLKLDLVELHRQQRMTVLSAKAMEFRVSKLCGRVASNRTQMVSL